MRKDLNHPREGFFFITKDFVTITDPEQLVHVVLKKDLITKDCTKVGYFAIASYSQNFYAFSSEEKLNEYLKTAKNPITVIVDGVDNTFQSYQSAIEFLKTCNECDEMTAERLFDEIIKSNRYELKTGEYEVVNPLPSCCSCDLYDYCETNELYNVCADKIELRQYFKKK